MLVTLSGILMLVSELQLSNADAAIPVTGIPKRFSGIIISLPFKYPVTIISSSFIS